jgi:hypothetical protein
VFNATGNSNVTDFAAWKGINSKSSSAAIEKAWKKDLLQLTSTDVQKSPAAAYRFAQKATQLGIPQQAIVDALAATGLSKQLISLETGDKLVAGKGVQIAKGAVVVHVTVQGNVDSETSAAKLGDTIGEKILADARMGKMVTN